MCLKIELAQRSQVSMKGGMEIVNNFRCFSLFFLHGILGRKWVKWMGNELKLKTICSASCCKWIQCSGECYTVVVGDILTGTHLVLF